jgi:hypothetical protein
LEDRPLAAAVTTQVLRIDCRCDAVRSGAHFVGINSVEMLFYSAVLNGVLEPYLIALAVLLASKSKRIEEVESENIRIEKKGMDRMAISDNFGQREAEHE